MSWSTYPHTPLSSSRFLSLPCSLHLSIPSLLRLSFRSSVLPSLPPSHSSSLPPSLRLSDCHSLPPSLPPFLAHMRAHCFKPQIYCRKTPSYSSTFRKRDADLARFHQNCTAPKIAPPPPKNHHARNAKIFETLTNDIQCWSNPCLGILCIFIDTYI